MADVDGATLAAMAALAAAANRGDDTIDERLEALGWVNVTDRLDIAAGRIEDGEFTRSNAAGFVAYDEDTRTLAIVFEGSLHVEEIGDARGALADYRDATVRQERHYELLQPLIDAGLALAEESPDDLPVERVLVTGHSLGGAMAEQFALRHTDAPGLVIDVASFGSPGVDFDGEPGPLAGRLVRIEHTGDAVTRLGEVPRLELERAGQIIEIDLPLIGDTGIGDGSLDFQGFLDVLSNQEHGPALYRTTGEAVFGSELFDQRSGDEVIRAIIDSDSDGDLKDYRWLDGSDEDEFLVGFAGDDRLGGGEGDDLIDGGAGDDRLHGGPGNDLLAGNDGSDRLRGEDGDDVLYAGGGTRNYLYGGDGADTLVSGTGIDRMWGGEGEDRFVLTASGTPGPTNLIYDWEEGEILDFSGIEGASRFTISEPFARSGSSGPATDVRVVVRDDGGTAVSNLILVDLGLDHDANVARLSESILLPESLAF